jgi:hypothetical protein
VIFGRCSQAPSFIQGSLSCHRPDRDRTWRLLRKVIEFLSVRGDPMKIMVNHVVEIDLHESITFGAMSK